MNEEVKTTGVVKKDPAKKRLMMDMNKEAKEIQAKGLSAMMGSSDQIMKELNDNFNQKKTP